MLALLLLVAAAAYKLQFDRVQYRAQEQSRLEIQARVIEENMVRQMQGVNSALHGVRYDMFYGDHEYEAAGLQLRLQVLVDAMPGVRAITVQNNTGYVVGSNRRDLLGKDFHQRNYFTVAIADPDYAALYVPPPFMSSVGILLLGMSKAISDERNQPVGVVAAFLDPEYFDILLRSVIYAPDMVVSLTHGDGHVVLLVPPNPRKLDMNLRVAGSFFSEHANSGGDTKLFIGRSLLENDERMVVMHSIQPVALRMTKPLTIALSRNLDAIDAPWHNEVRAYATLLGLIILGSCFSLGYVHNRRLAIKTVNDATRRVLADNAKRFEFGLKGADLGLWEWDLVQDSMSINERQWRMLGYAPDEIELTTEVWRTWLHPDEFPTLQAAFVAHIKGETLGYKLAHRVRHKDGHWIWVLDQAMAIERDANNRALRILGTYLDISEPKRAEAELAATTALLQRTGEIAKIGGWQIDLTNMQQTWTSEVFRIYGLPMDTAPSLMQSLSYFAPEARPLLEAAINKAWTDNIPWALELQMNTASNQAIWVRSRGEALWKDGRAVRLMGTLQDITERMQAQLALQQANKQLALMTITDGLTGVGNRRHFDQTLAAEWARSLRQRQPMALLMIDIDHFKLYNDHYGHQGGDACLREVARILQTCVFRPGEHLMRYGGEEFAILLLNTDTAGAATVAQRCLEQIHSAALPHAASLVSRTVSLSIGVASASPRTGLSAEKLVQAADAALYEAKHQGRARYICAEPTPTHHART